MLRILIIGLVLLVAAMMLMPRGGAPLPEPKNATVLPSTLALPAFSLQDQSGEPYSRDALLGHFNLMFFGFTNCPDVCPLTLQVLARTVEHIEAADPAKRPGVVFVSVDPHRDSPEQIRGYLASFDPSFAGITGPDDALAPLLKTLGVAVEKHEHEGDQYNVVHNGTIYMIGPSADLIAVSSPPHNPATLAADFVKIREWHLQRPERPAGPSPDRAAETTR